MYSRPGAATRHGTTSDIAQGVAAIATAIDQLAGEVRALTGSSEQTKRVAEIWLMVTSLDPELARCAERYQAPTPATQAAPTIGTADGASLL